MWEKGLKSIREFFLGDFRKKIDKNTKIIQISK